MDISAWELLLPEGILSYFDITEVEIKDEEYSIELTEKPLVSGEFKGQKLVSKGFHEVITVNDFPIRGKPCYLKVKRRRWLNETLSQTVSRDWVLVAKGTRMTKEFASFLKELHRYDPNKL